jgi:hypothetical protein
LTPARMSKRPGGRGRLHRKATSREPPPAGNGGAPVAAPVALLPDRQWVWGRRPGSSARTDCFCRRLARTGEPFFFRRSPLPTHPATSCRRLGHSSCARATDTDGNSDVGSLGTTGVLSSRPNSSLRGYHMSNDRLRAAVLSSGLGLDGVADRIAWTARPSSAGSRADSPTGVISTPWPRLCFSTWRTCGRTWGRRWSGLPWGKRSWWPSSRTDR